MYNKEMVDLDNAIIHDMSSMDESQHYRRYLTDRFSVVQVYEIENGLCAHIHDKETGHEMKVHTGDQLADGSVEIIEEGVVFHPPRADVESFMIPAAQEMAPLHSHSLTNKRDMLNRELEREHMMMPYDDEDDKMIIVLSAEPRM
tara:strand:+ start:282 stop:716 length:435 start_codon:yes stop_codon:yes gene_type:complete